VIRLSHTNTKDLIIKAGYCTNHWDWKWDCTVSAKHFLTGNANANSVVATDAQEPKQVFKHTTMACFYKQKSLRNKAVLWQNPKRNERNVAHT